MKPDRRLSGFSYRLLHNLLNLLAEITSRNHNSGLVIYAVLCKSNPPREGEPRISSPNGDHIKWDNLRVLPLKRIRLSAKCDGHTIARSGVWEKCEKLAGWLFAV